MILYEVFDSLKEALGLDYFTPRVSNEIVQNLNPKFKLREYQREALGRFDFYLNGYQKRQFPAQLLFHMATGSGKTLIMAANILFLYAQGYRNFIFFVNSTNIIEKTRDNFLNPLSEKYLFAQNIKFGVRKVDIKEVQNFEAVNPEDINIIFTTIQGLHLHLNNPRENSVTYEDFENKNVVFISDEAHHINALTKSRLNKGELEEKNSWEYTVERIFNADPKNILLEFTATIDLGNPNIHDKYKDKIIYQYDLKQFRLDKYSKEIEVLQADLDSIDRALQAVILSQYRRKIAEKHKIKLKPVILFKSNYVNPPKQRDENKIVSKEFKDKFLNKIKNLQAEDVDKFRASQSETIQKAFEYFDANEITTENLIREIQNDFEETKCLSVDSNEDKERNQVLVNSLEAKDNEIRAVFAVEMLNEGWDVLNLFDIIRLYNTRDAREGKPGKTTMSEAQLIGRGARYFPFQLDAAQDKYKRKFDEDINNDLRILEQLFYHSAYNVRYISELKTALTEIGIYPEKYVQKELFFKKSFKESDFWKNGVIFINDQVQNERTNIFSLEDVKITKRYEYTLRTGKIDEETILGDELKLKSPDVVLDTKTYKVSNFGENVIRNALDRFEFYKFEILKKYFPHIKSIAEFISSVKYLGDVEIEVVGPKDKLDNLTTLQKLRIAEYILKKISEEAKTNTSEFIGTKLFKHKLVKDIFGKNEGKKVLKLDSDSERVKEMIEINLADKDWYAQNEIYGTTEEKDFIAFIDRYIEKLKKKYSGIALIRNERYFKIFEFDEGRAFEPDFVLFLQNKKSKKIEAYQVFIEPKGDIYAKAEPWKEKFLLEIEEKADTDLKFKNKKFRLIGLPFYNEKLKQVFEEAFESKILN